MCHLTSTTHQPCGHTSLQVVMACHAPKYVAWNSHDAFCSHPTIRLLGAEHSSAYECAVCPKETVSRSKKQPSCHSHTPKKDGKENCNPRSPMTVTPGDSDCRTPIQRVGEACCPGEAFERGLDVLKGKIRRSSPSSAEPKSTSTSKSKSKSSPPYAPMPTNSFPPSSHDNDSHIHPPFNQDRPCPPTSSTPSPSPSPAPSPQTHHPPRPNDPPSSPQTLPLLAGTRSTSPRSATSAPLPPSSPRGKQVTGNGNEDEYPIGTRVLHANPSPNPNPIPSSGSSSETGTGVEGGEGCGAETW